MSTNKNTNKKELSTSWIIEEFTGLDLGDVCLNKRLLSVADALASHPAETINAACGDWASVKGAYRLFDNEKVSSEKILAPHFRQTIERMCGYQRVFAIQDTTYLDYTDHPSTEGLGPIGASSHHPYGFVKHTTLIVSGSGLPLGCLTDKVWVRDVPTQEKKRKSRPLVEKESYKWIEAVSAIKSEVPEGVEVISICDREADIYEFFVEAQEMSFVIRAAQDRVVDNDVGRLRALAESLPVAGEFSIKVAARGAQPAREATLSVSFAKTTLLPPQRSQASRSQELPAVEIYLVWVVETNPPDGTTPVAWLLLTNVEVKDFSDAIERVDWYAQRWHIEVYFKILKSGTKVEEVRFQTQERLLRFIALMSVIAWRLYWLTIMNRQTPDTDCTHILTEVEWKALYCLTHKTHILPKKLPTVSEAVIWIAKLGGFLGRKSDGEPGVTVIWRGWRRLSDISDTFALFHQDTQNNISQNLMDGHVP